MIAIIGVGNAGSVKNMLDYLGEYSKITEKKEDIEKAEKIILPGVGEFGDLIKSLKEYQLKEYLTDLFKKIKDGRVNKKFLGICIGLQVLFERSEESPNIKGLGIFKGTVKKFKKGKIPQIGWNKVKFSNNLKVDYFYFVNSYYVNPEDKPIILGETYYNKKFVSAIKEGNITATQFHVEKSGYAGINFMKWWLLC